MARFWTRRRLTRDVQTGSLENKLKSRAAELREAEGGSTFFMYE